MEIGDTLTHRGGTQDEIIGFTKIQGEDAVELRSRETGRSRKMLVVYARHLIAVGVFRYVRRGTIRKRLRRGNNDHSIGSNH